MEGFSFFFSPLSQTLFQKRSIAFHQATAHSQANLRELSHFHRGKRLHWFRNRPSSRFPQSLRPDSAYPLSSHLLLFRRWQTGAIMGSLRLALRQNVTQFKAGCQSAFSAQSHRRRLFMAYSANCVTERQRREAVPGLAIDYPAPPDSSQGLC